MNVMVVGPVGGACGIAEYGAMLREAIAPHGNVRDSSSYLEDGLDGTVVLNEGTIADVVHLNYHAAITSRWHPKHIQQLQSHGIAVVVTYHDTVTTGNSDQAKGLAAVANGFIVHEHVDDIPNAIVIPQPVPSLDTFPACVYEAAMGGLQQYTGPKRLRLAVGTVGFPLPWKNFDLLCEAAQIAGWNPVICSAGATDEMVAGWKQRCPRVLAITRFLTKTEIVGVLSSCDATAFLYTCHNAGTSGAIRYGIAAGKPLLAMRGCRQFVDLATIDTKRFGQPIHWVEQDAAHIAETLSYRLTLGPDPQLLRLAHEWSWERAAMKHVQVYRDAIKSLTQ